MLSSSTRENKNVLFEAMCVAAILEVGNKNNDTKGFKLARERDSTFAMCNVLNVTVVSEKCKGF